MSEHEEMTTQSNASGARTLRLSEIYSTVFNLARECTNISEFYRKSFAEIAKAFQCPFAELYANLQTQVIEEHWHSGPTAPDFWKTILQQFIDDSLTEAVPKIRMFNKSQPDERGSVAFLSSPLYNRDGGSSGVVVLVLSCRNEEQAKLRLHMLESLCYLLSYCGNQMLDQVENKNSKASVPIDHFSKIAGYTSTHELAFAIINNLRNRIGCEQVALGRVKRQRVQVMAISGLDDVPKRSPRVMRMREAMEECLDFGSTITYQHDSHDEDADRKEYHLHRQWHEASGNSAVASIPLFIESECMAILSLQRNAAQPFTADEIRQVSELVEPYVASFKFVEHANRSILTHVADSAVYEVKKAVSPGRWGKKVFHVVLLSFLAWFIFGSIDYQVKMPGIIMPAEVRHFAAPYDGKLIEVNVVPGDSVNKGDVLFRFDVKELEIQKRELESQYAIASLEERRFEFDQSGVEAQLAKIEKETIQAKLDLITYRIEQSSVRAPYDGVVMAGDLRKRIGGILSHGEPMCELAEMGRWQIELKVSEYLVKDIQSDLEGHFATNAKPEESYDLTIHRVYPNAEVFEGKNVYIAEATTGIDNDWIKPKMEGMAKIKVASRPVWWVVLHRAIDYVNMYFWI